jgi:hypothetical protein
MADIFGNIVGGVVMGAGNKIIESSPFGPMFKAAQAIFETIGHLVSASINNKYFEFGAYRNPLPEFATGEIMQQRSYIKAKFDRLPKGFFSQYVRESFYKPDITKQADQVKKTINYIPYIIILAVLLIIFIIYRYVKR